jgi:hypothetical protein
MAVSTCVAYPQFLVDQLPFYDELILSDIRPTDGWVSNVKQGAWDPFTNTDHTIDRFKHVYPNTTKVWNRTVAGSCEGEPCDKVEHTIGWGAERRTYYLEEQSWNTQLLCFDQMMHVTHAQEHFQQIIGKVLRPATNAIYSNFLRKRGLQFADNLLAANRTMTPFTFTWTVVGDEEIFLDMSIPPSNVFKLVPQMLQRQFNPLMAIGYAGENPYKDTAPYIELVTDIETAWELDKLGGATGVGGTPGVGPNWRFTQWGEANEYWRYGYSGQLGNFMVRTDPHQLRFQYVRDLGAGSAPNRYRYQVVLPYENEVTSGAGGAPGLGSVYNTDYELAQFTISFIWHKMGIEALVADAGSINPEMPFARRNFGGRWQFVMDNLGVGPDGCVVENKRRNKGQFIADFKVGIRPLHTEFIVAFFHKREPMCVPEINTCNPDPGYSTQTYGSENDLCE